MFKRLSEFVVHAGKITGRTIEKMISRYEDHDGELMGLPASEEYTKEQIDLMFENGLISKEERDALINNKVL